jgi:hypothetical protein
VSPLPLPLSSFVYNLVAFPPLSRIETADASVGKDLMIQLAVGADRSKAGLVSTLGLSNQPRSKARIHALLLLPTRMMQMDEEEEEEEG